MSTSAKKTNLKSNNKEAGSVVVEEAKTTVADGFVPEDIVRETAKWARIVKEAGATVE